MKISRKNILQAAAFIFIAVNCVVYGLYIKGVLGARLLSPSDLNPYGGWGHLKSAFMDVSYTWRGISRGIALTAAVTLVAIFAGRFLCGNLCPIGTIQDFMNYLGKRFGLRELNVGYEGKSGLDYIKFIVLVLVLIAGVMGFGSYIASFSPWLGFMNIFSGNIVLTQIIAIFIIGVSSLFTKRLFCRFLCPLGAYQGLIGAVGLCRIKAKADCGSCNQCLKDCPVEIKGEINGELPAAECIGCLKCVNSQCVKYSEGYQMYIGSCKTSSAKYIAVGLALLIAAYGVMPLLGRKNEVSWNAQALNLSDGSFVGIGTGFGGKIMTEITIKNGRISSIDVISHRESSGYCEEVFTTMEMEIKRTQNVSVEAISGATATSRGYIGAVKNGISQSIGKMQETE